MNAGHEDHWITGSRFYFQRDKLNSVEQPIIDLGRITNASPNVTRTDQTLYDGDGGIQRAVAVATTRVDEAYEFRCSNLNMDNLAMLFSAKPPSSFAQAATVRTDVSHYGIPGRLLKLVDTTGQPVYGIASIEAVTLGITPMVEGTDWEIVSLERGIIRIFETSTVFTTPGSVLVDYTPRAITGPNRRLLLPNTEACQTLGTGLFFWGRCGNAQQTVREARVQMTTTGATFPDDNFADFGLRITVLSDPRRPIPSGRLLYWLGDEPDAA